MREDSADKEHRASIRWCQDPPVSAERRLPAARRAHWASQRRQHWRRAILYQLRPDYCHWGHRHVLAQEPRVVPRCVLGERPGYLDQHLLPASQQLSCAWPGCRDVLIGGWGLAGNVYIRKQIKQDVDVTSLDERELRSRDETRDMHQLPRETRRLTLT